MSDHSGATKTGDDTPVILAAGAVLISLGVSALLLAVRRTNKKKA
ncbi:LPXTG cell wall anchor domain-containing protein [Lachnotalea sp. AF33-28]|nr:LPXTG cell wall anchor domain-containing protein [Lachnotalea sp. AF33-28]